MRAAFGVTAIVLLAACTGPQRITHDPDMGLIAQRNKAMISDARNTALLKILGAACKENIQSCQKMAVSIEEAQQRIAEAKASAPFQEAAAQESHIPTADTQPIAPAPGPVAQQDLPPPATVLASKKPEPFQDRTLALTPVVTPPLQPVLATAVTEPSQTNRVFGIIPKDPGQPIILSDFVHPPREVAPAAVPSQQKAPITGWQARTTVYKQRITLPSVPPGPPRQVQTAPALPSATSAQPAPTEVVPPRAPVIKQNLVAPNAKAPAAVGTAAPKSTEAFLKSIFVKEIGTDIDGRTINTVGYGPMKISQTADAIELSSTRYKITYYTDKVVKVQGLNANGSEAFAIGGEVGNGPTEFKHSGIKSIALSAEYDAAKAAGVAISALHAAVGEPAVGPGYKFKNQFDATVMRAVKSHLTTGLGFTLMGPAVGSAAFGRKHASKTTRQVSRSVADKLAEISRNVGNEASSNGNIIFSTALGAATQAAEAVQTFHRINAPKVGNLFRTAADLFANARTEFSNKTAFAGEFARNTFAGAAKYMQENRDYQKSRAADFAAVYESVFGASAANSKFASARSADASPWLQPKAYFKPALA